MDSDRLDRAVITIMCGLGLRGESKRRFRSRVIADWQMRKGSRKRTKHPRWVMMNRSAARATSRCHTFSGERCRSLGAVHHPCGLCGEVNHYGMARAWTDFLEALVYEVDTGQLVRIPGFGCFGSTLYRIDQRAILLSVLDLFQHGHSGRKCGNDALRS